MPTERQFIQCDCGKGELAEIVETHRSRESSCCGTPLTSTVFYECNKCKTIFKRNRTDDFQGSQKVYFNKFQPYKGRLTRDELVKYSPEVYGTFIEGYDEERILKLIQPAPAPPKAVK